MSEHCHVAFYMFITIVVIIIKLLNHLINIIIVTVIITGISNNKKNVCIKPTYINCPLNCPALSIVYDVIHLF